MGKLNLTCDNWVTSLVTGRNSVCKYTETGLSNSMKTWWFTSIERDLKTHQEMLSKSCSGDSGLQSNKSHPRLPNSHPARLIDWESPPSWVLAMAAMSSIFSTNQVIISTNLPAGAPRGWHCRERNSEGDNKFRAAGHWEKGTGLPGASESYLWPSVRLPSGRDTHAGHHTEGVIHLGFQLCGRPYSATRWPHKRPTVKSAEEKRWKPL